MNHGFGGMVQRWLIMIVKHGLPYGWSIPPKHCSTMVLVVWFNHLVNPLAAGGGGERGVLWRLKCTRFIIDRRFAPDPHCPLLRCPLRKFSVSAGTSWARRGGRTNVCPGRHRPSRRHGSAMVNLGQPWLTILFYHGLPYGWTISEKNCRSTVVQRGLTIVFLVRNVATTTNSGMPICSANRAMLRKFTGCRLHPTASFGLESPVNHIMKTCCQAKDGFRPCAYCIL